ncbi:MAG: SpoIID/LytB domain-containing protein [Myxococcaceae bacterium]|nr:SpoIID/LytB domain-containing protein [Myxococcaceae bacterium]
MRIAIGPEVKQARLAGDGLFRGDDDEGARFLPLESPDVTVTRKGGALFVDGSAVSGRAVRFRRGGAIDVNGTRVRGDVVALLGRDGVQLVNVLALEDYLAGVLGSEMPKSFPLEALKAQAVAARTYALHKKLEQYGQPFHLGSSVISQVYGGLASEDPRTREAVEATRGMVLTHQLQPVEAYFHASCGGKTESGAEALGRDLPYLKPVSCPCAKLPQAEWRLELDQRIQVTARSATGRATKVLLDGRPVDAVLLRERIGYMKLKSLWFEVSGKTLSGHGFGHGAGMCQWGAKVLAERGMGYREILGHYYVGTELQTLY